MDNNKKNILSLSAVSFINDISSKMILPVLPLFITAIGGAGFAVGLVTGVGKSIASIMKVLVGYWSDKSGKRKIFVLGGYATSAFGKLLMAVAVIWPHAVVFRAIERVGKGLRAAPRDAILAASTEQVSRGKWFGVHRAMDSGGAVVGSLITFALLWWAGLDMRIIFAIAGSVAFLSIVPILFVKEKKAAIPEEKKTLAIQLQSLSPELRRFIAIAAIFALGNFGYMFFVLRSQTAFSGLLSVAAPVLLYALYNLFSSIFAVPAGKLSDRFGRKPILAIGFGLFALVSAGFIFATSVWMMIVLFVLFGTSYALFNANQRAYVSDISREDNRATALGTFQTVISIVALPAGMIAGALWDIAPLWTFVYGAGLTGLAALLLIVVPTKKSNQ